MKILLSHPTGNQFVRAIVSALSKEELLSEFHTTVAANSLSPWVNILPKKVKSEFLRRSYPVSGHQVHTHPSLELTRLLLTRAGFKNSVKHETGWASVDAVYKDIDKKVADRLFRLNKKAKPDGVYAYEDGAIHSFKAAKQLGIKCLYDLPIGYWRAARIFLETERELWPDWAATLTVFADSTDKLKRKDEELRLADEIFVASSFTANTLKYFPQSLAPVKIIPYGFPPVIETRSYNTNLSGSRRLKLLFVGGLSQRKGIANLFSAVDAFRHNVTLTVVGNKTGDNCPALNEALAKHHWISSLPHEGILKLMREHDVLVFPSLFEGFGLVITEAMAQGMPVITTDRTAGPDIINDKENGWLIEAGSTEKIKEAIENILLTPSLIKSVGNAAIETARKRPWEVYGQELLRAIINNIKYI